MLNYISKRFQNLTSTTIIKSLKVKLNSAAGVWHQGGSADAPRREERLWATLLFGPRGKSEKKTCPSQWERSIHPDAL